MMSAYHGTDGDDTINASASSDLIDAGAGDDTINAGAGNDRVIGGAGNYSNTGGPGNDTFEWNPGDGSDTVYDNQGSNVLEIGEGVSAEATEISRVGNDLVVRMPDAEGSTVTIREWYDNGYYAHGENVQLAEIRFADGTRWTRAQVNAMMSAYHGTDGDDTINASASSDLIEAGAGDDTISAGAGNDRVIGGAGDDKIEGGAGNDTFVWNPGDGSDTVYDNQGSNALEIGEGVSAEATEISRVGNDLVVRMPDAEGSTVTVREWYNNGYYAHGDNVQLSEIRFADGTKWSRKDVNDIAAGVISPFSQIRPYEGKGGNDTLNGSDGDDVLIGRAGDDTLLGGNGDDTYKWNPGDGKDTIIDSQGANALVLGAGTAPSDVDILRVSDDLVFRMDSAGGERVVVKNWYNTAEYGADAQLSEVRFADGTTWSRADINAKTAILGGLEGDDTITGTPADDVIDGGVGNDTLYGAAGNDTLVGNLGDDRLEGGAGNDTYVWNPGDGNDTISDSSGTNALKIGGGVDPAGVRLAREGEGRSDAVFIMPEGERVTVEKWFSAAANQLSEVRFDDGTVWKKADVNAMTAILEGTGSAETITGTGSSDEIRGNAGDDTLSGAGGNDTLIGGTGADRLEGGAGNDTYVWNPGDGSDTVLDSSGTNALEIGEGVSPSDVTLLRSGAKYADLSFVMPDGGGVTVEKWLSGSSYQLSEVRFADGTVWTKADVNGMKAAIGGTESADAITGTSGNDAIYGLGGNDTLEGGSGNDSLSGGAGDDALNGDAGDDTLSGGAGTDRLEGGAGNDTYLWNPGDGDDTIYDNSGTNVLKIGEGADPAGLSLSKSGNSLVMQAGDGSLTLEDWYKGAKYQLASVEFADSTVWTKADVNDIAAGTKAPFSTAPAQTGAMSSGFIGDAGTEEALALLSSPSLSFESDPGSYIPDESGTDTFPASSSGADGGIESVSGTDWNGDPGLTAAGGTEASAPSDYGLALQDMEIAVAGLGFGTEEEGTAGEAPVHASAAYAPLAAAAAESSLGDYFSEEESRRSA
jgi:Ca2+-binding RTX toxin-like protein